MPTIYVNTKSQQWQLVQQMHMQWYSKQCYISSTILPLVLILCSNTSACASAACCSGYCWPISGRSHPSAWPLLMKAPVSLKSSCSVTRTRTKFGIKVRKWTWIKLKDMTSGESRKRANDTERWPCGVCSRGVGRNSIQFTKTPFTRYNRLSNRFDNQFDNRLYHVNGA